MDNEQSIAAPSRRGFLFYATAAATAHFGAQWIAPVKPAFDEYRWLQIHHMMGHEVSVDRDGGILVYFGNKVYRDPPLDLWRKQRAWEKATPDWKDRVKRILPAVSDDAETYAAIRRTLSIKAAMDQSPTDEEIERLTQPYFESLEALAELRPNTSAGRRAVLETLFSVEKGDLWHNRSPLARALVNAANAAYGTSLTA